MAITSTELEPSLLTGFDDMGSLASARRGARVVLALLWLASLPPLFLLPIEAGLAILVLLVGVTTQFESAHGARAVGRLLARHRIG